MASRRTANTVYVIFVLAISAIVFAIKFNKFHPSDQYIYGRVKSVAKRSGWQYAKLEASAFIAFYFDGLIPLSSLLLGLLIRAPARVLPAGLQKSVYKLLRQA